MVEPMLDPDDGANLAKQMRQGRALLFTGAGFSFGATDRDGRPVPSATSLRNEIWELVWPGSPVDPDATLASVYAVALRERRRDLTRLLETRLDVLPESVTPHHRQWLSLPWLRAYTLNIAAAPPRSNGFSGGQASLCLSRRRRCRRQGPR